MKKKTFWQRLRLMEAKIAYSFIIGIGIGLAMGIALDNWGAGIAIGVGIGTALSAGWSQQEEKKDQHKES